MAGMFDMLLNRKYDTDVRVRSVGLCAELCTTRCPSISYRHMLQGSLLPCENIGRPASHNACP